MKILGIAGSNRKEGNSYRLIKEAFKGLSPIETKIVQVAELKISPCELCFKKCAKNPFECIIKDDFGKLLKEMKSADGIVVACPFYFYIPSRFQAFLERICSLDYCTASRHGKNLSPLKGKPCLLIAVSASGSSFNGFQVLNHLQDFALMLDMKPLRTKIWPYIGLPVKSGDDIRKETETIKQARNQLRSLTREIAAKNKA